MPPFQPQPRLEVRQAVYGVTLTVTRSTTTYTTFITLGAGRPPTETTLPTTTTISLQTTEAATTTPAVSTPTTIFIGTAPTSSGTPNGVVVGAILGSFLGFCILLAILWYCCYGGRTCCIWYDDSDSDSYDSSYDSRSSESRTRIRVRTRGGWAGNYGVRRPDRARVRVKRESTTTTTRSGSQRRVIFERRKSDRVPLFGFMYFGLNGPPRSELVSRIGRRSGRRRESIIGRRSVVDD